MIRPCNIFNNLNFSIFIKRYRFFLNKIFDFHRIIWLNIIILGIFRDGIRVNIVSNIVKLVKMIQILVIFYNFCVKNFIFFQKRLIFCMILSISFILNLNIRKILVKFLVQHIYFLINIIYILLRIWQCIYKLIYIIWLNFEIIH